jgi:aminoglycoside N3'-acetyltransferase
MTLTTSRITEGVVRRFKRARRKLVHLNEAKIREALDSFGAFKGDVLLVHSSLSACGSIDGGPGTVINALRSWITDRAALALPTHTWSYPDATGVAPVYDFRSTSSVVGTITNHYWNQPSVGAEDLCRDHELRETPCGAGTPYLRIAEGNSSVLMFGATMDSYTLFHTAEDSADVPYLYYPEQVTLRTRDADGDVKNVQMWRQDMSVTRRFEATADWLAEQGLLVRRRLGLGELLFIPSARALHERVVDTMRRDPLFLVDEKARAEVSTRMKTN